MSYNSVSLLRIKEVNPTLSVGVAQLEECLLGMCEVLDSISSTMYGVGGPSVCVLLLLVNE